MDRSSTDQENIPPTPWFIVRLFMLFRDQSHTTNPALKSYHIIWSRQVYPDHL